MKWTTPANTPGQSTEAKTMYAFTVRYGLWQGSPNAGVFIGFGLLPEIVNLALSGLVVMLLI
jgi:hypothetical protein